MSCEVINPTAALPELEVVEMHIHTTNSYHNYYYYYYMIVATITDTATDAIATAT